MIRFFDYNYSTPYDHAIDQWASAKKYSDGNKLIKPWSDFRVGVTKLEVFEERSWKMELFFEGSFTSNWYQMIWANADKVGEFKMPSLSKKERSILICIYFFNLTNFRLVVE